MANHDHYKKDVRHLDMIDVYRVLELFNVTHPGLQHAAKKILAAGNRGAKDWEKDVREAVDSLNRALEMRAEDAGLSASKDNFALARGFMEAPLPEFDPHAELRKTWRPGQRWQFKDAHTHWCNVTGPPVWNPYLDYRRHPDDIQEGSGNG